MAVPALLMTVMEAVLPGEEWVVLTSALLHAPFYLYVFFATWISWVLPTTTGLTPTSSTPSGPPSRCSPGRSRSSTSRWKSSGPGSIEPLNHGTARFFDLLFFSFTNLTSVGLSDILPVGATPGRW